MAQSVFRSKYPHVARAGDKKYREKNKEKRSEYAKEYYLTVTKPKRAASREARKVS